MIAKVSAKVIKVDLEERRLGLSIIEVTETALPIEAEEQVEEALLSCKTDQDFYMVYDGFKEIYEIQGKIKDSLKYDEKKFDCEKKYICNMFHSQFYIFS